MLGFYGGEGRWLRKGFIFDVKVFFDFGCGSFSLFFFGVVLYCYVGVCFGEFLSNSVIDISCGVWDDGGFFSEGK